VTPFDLSGRVALVTGASRGLGAAMARALARAGADVALHASRLEPADLAAAVASEHGVQTASFAADLARRTESASLVPRTLERFGRLDVLVNNAGMIRRADAREFSDDDWDAVLEVDLSSVFRLSRDAGQHMLDRGSGKIINIASVLSFQGGIRVPAYAAAKGAVAQLTKALANEWAGRGVNVNAIRAGIYPDRQHPRLAGRRGAEPADSGSDSGRDGGASRTIWAVPSSFWRPRRQTTCTVTCWWWTAAGWVDKVKVKVKKS
jgi:2-deoxy-D-gluconate 3-dehydrogenase